MYRKGAAARARSWAASWQPQRTGLQSWHASTKKPHGEPQAPDAAPNAAGGLAVTLWLLAILVAQVEVILWIGERMYAP